MTGRVAQPQQHYAALFKARGSKQASPAGASAQQASQAPPQPPPTAAAVNCPPASTRTSCACLSSCWRSASTSPSSTSSSLSVWSTPQACAGASAGESGHRWVLAAVPVPSPAKCNSWQRPAVTGTRGFSAAGSSCSMHAPHHTPACLLPATTLWRHPAPHASNKAHTHLRTCSTKLSSSAVAGPRASLYRSTQSLAATLIAAPWFFTMAARRLGGQAAAVELGRRLANEQAGGGAAGCGCRQRAPISDALPASAAASAALRFLGRGLLGVILRAWRAGGREDG